MANFTFSNATATIGSTEYSLAQNANYSSGTPKTSLGYVQAVVDVSALAAGDQYQLRVYEKANAGTQRLALEAILTGTQGQSYVTPLMLLGEGWDVTLKKLAGTDRSILFSVRQDTNDVNANTISAGAVTSIQTGLPLATDYTSARAAKLDNLDAAVTTRASSSTALSTAQWTNTRAGLLDNLDATVSSRASSSALATIQADTDDIQTRLPAALVGGRMSSDVGSWLGTAAATPTVAGIPKVEEATLRADYTTARAAKLDNLDAAVTTRAAAATALSTADYTSARAIKLDDLDATISSRAAASTAVSNANLTPTRAALLDNLDAAVTTRAPSGTALSTVQWTNARAADLDNLDVAISSRASASAAASLQIDTDDIQSRLPAALDGSGNMKTAVQSIGSAALDELAAAVFAFVVEPAPAGATTFLQRLRVMWSIFASKASGLAISTAGTEHFRDAADAKDRATFALATDGTRTPGTFDGT